MNILLINPGRRDYLVKYFLDLSKIFKLKIFLIDPNKFIPSFSVSKKTFNFISPTLDDKKKFVIFLKKFVKKNKINVIFPISEHELQILADEKMYFEKIGVCVVISNSKIIQLCNNKLLTNEFLLKNKILFPKVLSYKKINKNLPVIKKDVFGNGSKDQGIIKNTKEIPKINHKKYFFQKYLNYQEYGMDILNDLNGKYVHSCVKKKLQMRAGDTDRVQIVHSKIFEKIAKKISFAL